MPSAYCHQCEHEFESDDISACPACSSTFIEERESLDSERDRRREQQRQERQINGGAGGSFPFSALLASLGLAPPVGGVAMRSGGFAIDGGVGGSGVAGGRVDEQVDDPDDLVLPPRFARQGTAVALPGASGVPIHSLAAYLGDAFDDEPADHDHEGNNTFAEHNAQEVVRRPRARSVGSRDRAPNQPPHQVPNPLEYLINLIGSLGGNGGQAILGGPGVNSVGDFAIGDSGFDRILSELLDQAGATRAGPLPASQEIIASLPKTKMSKDMLALSSMNECPICRDDFELEVDLTEMPCHHYFHSNCLVLWLNTNGSCPVCRFSLLPDPSEAAIPAPVPTHNNHLASASTSASTSAATGSALTSTAMSGHSRASGSIPGSYPSAEYDMSDDMHDTIMSEDVD